MYLLAKFGGHKSYGSEDINFYMTTSEKVQLTTSICILWDFQNQEHRFTIPKSLTQFVEKQQQKEEERRKLQSVMNFTQSKQNIFSFSQYLREKDVQKWNDISINS